MEPVCTNLPCGWGPDVFGRGARLRQGQFDRDVDRQRRARVSLHYRTFEFAYGRGSARARCLSRCPDGLLARHLYARHLRAASHNCTFQSSRTRDILCFEAPLGGLRAPGADRSADVRVHGQFWLLDRIALGRSVGTGPLAVARRSEYSDQLLRQFAGHSTYAVCDRWAIALLGAGIWAVWANRRWMVNITA